MRRKQSHEVVKVARNVCPRISHIVLRPRSSEASHTTDRPQQRPTRMYFTISLSSVAEHVGPALPVRLHLHGACIWRAGYVRQPDVRNACGGFPARRHGAAGHRRICGMLQGWQHGKPRRWLEEGSSLGTGATCSTQKPVQSTSESQCQMMFQQPLSLPSRLAELRLSQLSNKSTCRAKNENLRQVPASGGK